MPPTASINRNRRLGLYGGAFDPVHCGHLAVARAALEQARLGRMVFVPAARSPLKETSPGASGEERMAMLRLALGDEPAMTADPVELERGGVSYTLDTVRHFRNVAPEAELCWVVGADQFVRLDRWRRIDELATQVTFLVLDRPGCRTEAPPVSGLRFERVAMPLREESSTEIRLRRARGQSINGLVPGAVESFIVRQRLYSKRD